MPGVPNVINGRVRAQSSLLRSFTFQLFLLKGRVYSILLLNSEITAIISVSQYETWARDKTSRDSLEKVPGHLETFVKIFSAQIKSYKNCGSCITMS